MKDKENYTFKGVDITVTWNKDTCTHSGICVKNLRSVFQPGTKPWVKADAATAQEIKDVIDKCPSKALRYDE